MTEATINIFFKFQELWRAGTNARLSIECHAGKAWINLHVQLDQPPGPQPQQHQRRQGPSRVRRRERRKQEHECASTAGKAVVAPRGDVLPHNDSVDNVAEEAASDEILQDSFEAVAEKADNEVPAVEAAPSIPVQSVEHQQLNVLAKPWPTPVLDELCPEEEYQHQSRSSPRVPPDQCKICGKTFGSRRALGTHEMKYHEA